MRIQFVVPDAPGGVHDFSRCLVDAIGDHAELVPLSKSGQRRWMVEEDTVVILQMSGYGFDRRGAPLWLLRAVTERRVRMRLFGVFFHELFARGPPWRSSFWLSYLQKKISRNLVRAADFWMSNRQMAALWLGPEAACRPHAVLPVFSNVGEVEIPCADRKPIAVVFGGDVVRRRTYRNFGEKLFRWAVRSGLQLVDVGPPIADAKIQRYFFKYGVIRRGILSPQEISSILSVSSYGIISYPMAFIAKSSVFAAYCAHAVCPIVISGNYHSADGVEANRQFVPGIPKGTLSPSLTRNVGLQAWQWYQPHCLRAHADAVRRLAAGGGVH